MADGFRATADPAAVDAALTAVVDAASLRTTAASRISARRIQSEMRSRVARATGKTAEDINVTDVDDGAVVHTRDVNPFTGAYYGGKHVGLWLEKGTHLGKRGSHASAARPWFFVSAQLELAAHERRIGDALNQAITDVGLGD